jgi:ATP-dependent Clp protease ATP-binding subunit ClpA
LLPDTLRFGQPVASTLLLGPTGTGKTRLVELVNECLFGNTGKLIRLDLSEYQNQSSLEQLTGTGGRGLFGQYCDRAGGSGTLLFDEIEKAHQQVLDVLLKSSAPAGLLLWEMGKPST